MFKHCVPFLFTILPKTEAGFVLYYRLVLIATLVFISALYVFILVIRK